MIPLLPGPHTAALWLAVGTLGLVLLRLMLPSWWRRPRLRALTLSLLAIPGTGVAAWEFGPLVKSWPMSYYGMVVAWTTLIPVSFVVLTLPMAALVQKLIDVVGPVSPPPPAPARPLARREVLSMAGAVVPAIAFGTGVAGWTGAAREELIPHHPLRFQGLPPDLQGYRILHLSDLHLGCNKHVDDLERLLIRAQPRGADLVVVTGDVADDLGQLRDALGLLRSFRTRHGTYICLGNHEYLRDIRRALRIFEQGGLPLLVNDGAVLPVGGATLFLAGVDDPGYRPVNVPRFLAQGINSALDGAPSESFTLLLSHRPQGFLHAAQQGVNLTLAGHTHGSQVAPLGPGGRRYVDDEIFAWGDYQRGKSRLYTTSGFGHWFPFRLGCPAEVPLIELQGA